MDKNKLKDQLKSLEEIVEWFDGQEEVDVEAGLDKVKEGVALIKVAKERLKELENEFEKVKKGLGDADVDNE
ncbi:MAG TPA: exodeoxyribonuclease VII small subunit [Bacteroidales bacterium]|jgi:exonuclease VII small subunit|nr:exodeoxyribonuclease VII small subunit [Bacteroidales bacterium]